MRREKTTVVCWSEDKYDVDGGGGDRGGVMVVDRDYFDVVKHCKDPLSWEERVTSIALFPTEKMRLKRECPFDDLDQDALDLEKSDNSVTLVNDEANDCANSIPSLNGNLDVASYGVQEVVMTLSDLNLNVQWTLEVVFRLLRDYVDYWGLSECGYDESTRQTY